MCNDLIAVTFLQSLGVNNLSGLNSHECLIFIWSVIVDGQQVIGFECAGLRPDLAKDYWRGLEFYNSTVKRINDKLIMRQEPLSWLEYLDISYAGKDVYRGDGMIHGRAAISASPHVPLMNNVTITNSAYDGLNLTEVRGRIHIANSTVSSNRGMQKVI